jgi:hypothetical protein
MLNSLSRSITTLNGVSGAGKGEIFKKIKEGAEAAELKVHYIGSGDLFRLQQEMAIQLRTGYYPNTLDAIRDAFKLKFKEFLEDFINTNGKAILITDGLIRRGAHDLIDSKLNKTVHIVHQVDQVAIMMKEVFEEKAAVDPRVGEMFPELKRWQKNEPLLEELFKNTLKRANHVMVDIYPEDALELLENRARKELARIESQDKSNLTLGHCASLKRILNGELWFGEEKQWRSVKDAEGTIPAAYCSRLNDMVEVVRKDLAVRVANLGENASLMESFAKLGIKTDIRNDDVSPAGRIKRVENNYVQTEGGKYAAGFAVESWRKLGVWYDSEEGRLRQLSVSVVIVENGKSKDVSFDELKNKAKSVGEGLIRRQRER